MEIQLILMIRGGIIAKLVGTSQVLFGQGGSLGLSDAYGGMWEDPQEKGTMSGVDGGYERGASASGMETVIGSWQYVPSWGELVTIGNGSFTYTGMNGDVATFQQISETEWVIHGAAWVFSPSGAGRGSGTDPGIGALRELGGVFLKESLNFGNRWPFYVPKGKSCQDYAYDLKDRLLESNLQFWNPATYSIRICVDGVSVWAHFTVVLEPINGNPLPNTWIDFYIFPNIIIGGAEEGITILTPSVYIVYQRFP